MKRRSGFNPKRRIRAAADPKDITRLANSIHYSGNPEHKRNPGDFGLTPPSQPRADKTLCDVIKIFSRKEAEALLKTGVEKGLFSEQEQNGYPQNIWAVTVDGYPLEAQLENALQGHYHGYPMPEADPFRDAVLAKWRQA
jgi:hypothetical protein